MDPQEKWEYLTDRLGESQYDAVEILINYNGLNHEVLDYAAEEFGINWDEHEDEEEGQL